MTDFNDQFRRIDLLQKQLDRAQAMAGKKQAALDAEFAELTVSLHPICVKAIGLYNVKSEAGGFLTIDNILHSIDRTKRTVSIALELRYHNGQEPYDSWDVFEDMSYSHAFAPIMNQLLAEAAVPLTFGHLSFPPSYYIK